MDTSAVPILRPLRLGELLDQAVRLYRRNFLTFVGIIAIGYLPFAILQIAATGLSIYGLENSAVDPFNPFTSPSYWLSIFGSLSSTVLYFILVTGLSTAALVNTISRNYLGQKTDILEAYRLLGSSWLKLLATIFLFGLFAIVAIIWTIVPCVGWLSGPGLLIFLSNVVGQIIPAVVVIEKVDGSRAISRAWDLARRRFWWLLGFSVVFYLFNTLVVTGPTALMSYLTVTFLNQTDLAQNAQLIATVSSSLAGSFLHLLILPIQLTAWTLVYFDLRVRTEGFDLALATLEPSNEPGADLSALPVTISAQWLTGEDVGRFVAMTLVVGGLYALFVGILAIIGVSLGSLGGL